MPSRRVLFCAAEVEPFAKVGGLADVAGSLPRALNDLGHDVRVLMPAYGMVLADPRWNVRPVAQGFPVHLNPQTTVLADLHEAEADGLKVWLLGGDAFFSEVLRSEDVYTPGRDAYLFFARAVGRVADVTGWSPDVVHAHDWHMGFVPAVLRESRPDFAHTACVFTVHNLAYQGTFGTDTLDAVGLPQHLYNPDQVEAWGAVNFLKAGCAISDAVNTVSPTYAEEIQTAEFGCGLEGLMRHLAALGRLSGVLNGIDTRHHDPATDPRLPAHFSADDLTGKAVCRKALLAEAGLPEPVGPVLAMVTRLSPQKGFDLLVEAADRALATGAALVVLGVGDPWAAGELRRLEREHPAQVKFFEGYHADLAQLVYAGADGFLMPSRFEPCGLGQMFAMRYGTVPVVRRTGGLADTVREGENGFVFDGFDPSDLAAAIERLAAAFADTEVWRGLVLAGMRADWGWGRSATEYVRLYEATLTARRHDLAETAV